MNQEILEARFTHDEIVRKYNRIASVYDLFGILMESKARQRALDLAAIQDGEKIMPSISVIADISLLKMKLLMF